MKENGFAIGLLIATLVIGGALVALGLSQGSRYAAAEAEYSEIKDDVERMAAVKPFPTEENLEERETEVVAFRGKVEGLQNAIQAYRPEKLESIAPAEFQNRLDVKSKAIKKTFKSKNRLDGGVKHPEQFAFGMESYLAGLPTADATGKLNYQLEALEWLFKELAQDGVWEIRNCVREALPSESGKDWKDEFTRNGLDVPLAQSMPIEVSFLADEDVANAFINRLVSSKEYFFVVDAMRISNERNTPPVRADSGLEGDEVAAEDAEDEGGFGQFDALFAEGTGEDEDEEEPAAEEDGEAEIENEEAPVVEEGLILGQILGSEAVYVGLQIRLLLFEEPIELPEFN